MPLINWSSARERIKAEVLAVCWSGAFGCVLTQCKEGKSSATVLEKRLCCHQSGKSRSIRQLKLGQNWLMQQDNDPKHTSKSYNWTAEKKRINVFSRPYLDWNAVVRAVWTSAHKPQLTKATLKMSWPKSYLQSHTENIYFKLLLIQGRGNRGCWGCCSTPCFFLWATVNCCE